MCYTRTQLLMYIYSRVVSSSPALVLNPPLAGAWFSHTSEDPLLVTGGSSNAEAHVFDWRDAFDVLVLWRQLSEPNDPVWWVDLLTPEQFAEGE